MTHQFRVFLPAWMSSKSLLKLPMPSTCLPLRPPYNIWDSRLNADRVEVSKYLTRRAPMPSYMPMPRGRQFRKNAYKFTADLTAAKDNAVQVPAKTYQELIGSLSFICDTTHPTISWMVGVLGRHLHCPTERHMAASKMVLRYLKGGRECGTTLKHTGPIQLAAYSDSDYASDLDTRGSVTGTLVTASHQPFLGTSTRQKSTTHSSTESEYIAADLAASQPVWISPSGAAPHPFCQHGAVSHHLGQAGHEVP
jgi:hypothetical protein